ncbi:MAG: heavy metal translocating P-type ATPase [Bryobacterales bacterium]|nr:heavy metal translocating P-type ATPase [Bryobacterales bacterium]
MTCTACANNIETRLAQAPGVEFANVSFAARTVAIRFNPVKVQVEALVSAIEGLGYQVPRSSEAPSLELESKALQTRLALGGLLAVPTMILGMAERLPFAQLALSLPVLAYSGLPFYQAAWKAARNGTVNMNTLVSLGTLAAFSYSAFVLMQGGHHVYFEAAPVIIVLVLLGRYLELRARSKASAAIEHLANLQPPSATLIHDDQEKVVPVADVKPGDILIVKPGDRIPVDGTILEGASEIDESMLTGEAMPAIKSAGYNVSAGTRNLAGAFRLQATRTGAATALAQIADMVQAQASRAPVARLADAVASRFTLAIIVIALLTLGIWLFFAPVGTAVQMAVAVLIVACPCAMGLATPMALIAGTGRAAAEGVLFRNGDALESAAKIDTVVFDKTGTLTRGTPRVASIHVEPGFTEESALDLAAAVDRWSEHPFAKAILEKHGDQPLAQVTGFRAIAGTGAEGTVDGKLVFIGRSRKGTVELVVDGQTAAHFQMEDQLRPGAAEAVAKLRRMGITVWMLSGDSEEAAQAIAHETGIPPGNVMSRIMPAEKEEIVTRFRGQGRHVAMVGDGINDAPALAAASVGIAIGAGTDVAIESAGVILMASNPLHVPRSLDLARATLRIIRQNLFWAFGYNTLAIPVAAGLFYHSTGWTLSPMLASAAMALSSVSVVLNSLRLRTR